MEQIPFQIEAVDKLVANIKRLWGHRDRQIPVVLKAPTGSGKTYMTQKMICEMAEQPDWDREGLMYGSHSQTTSPCRASISLMSTSLRVSMVDC